jgi:hypothetical protein
VSGSNKKALKSVAQQGFKILFVVWAGIEPATHGFLD